jgi:hypothetical protein
MPTSKKLTPEERRQVIENWDFFKDADQKPGVINRVAPLLFNITPETWVGREGHKANDTASAVFCELLVALKSIGHGCYGFNIGGVRGMTLTQFPFIEYQELPEWMPLDYIKIEIMDDKEGTNDGSWRE